MNRLLVFLGLLLAFASSEAAAWEVKLDKHNGWKSMYCVDVPGVGTQCRETGSLHGVHKTDLRGNEHAEITDHMFWMISDQLGKKFGVHACVTQEDADENCPLLVDLNASYLRRNVVGGTILDASTAAGDLADTELEERRQPPLAMWSSLPDYGYNVYDWINKMRICPALPKTAEHRNLCWDYGAWLGGAMNSTHFGHMPMKMYDHYHQLALKQAGKAKLAREAMEKDQLPAAEWHKTYLQEMEMLALVYETTAQHFLADRWATGHMMSRWGAPSYETMLARDGRPQLEHVVAYGILTGMLHGSQAVFEAPDPLNGPFLHSSSAASDLLKVFGGEWSDILGSKDGGTISNWRYTVDNTFSPPTQTQGGVGDLAFDALIKRSYSGTKNHRVDPPISLASATNQRKGLVYCATQGIRHVIAALGQNEDGSYGVDKLKLPKPEDAEMRDEWVPSRDGAEHNPEGQNPANDPLCTQQWVTNESWYLGLRTIAGQKTLFGDVYVIATSPGKPPAGWTPPIWSVLRATEAYTKAWQEALRQVKYDEDRHDLLKNKPPKVAYGTELARRSPSFSAGGYRWRGNYGYPVPNHLEPIDLDDLEELNNEYGKDKAAVYGLFNKAGTHYWCEKLPETLAELRDEIQSAAPLDRPRLVATCSYLAQRAYKGVEDSYGTEGPRYEVIGRHLPKDEATKFGEEYEPICRWFETGESIETTDASDDSKPYTLSPGYVVEAGEFGDYAPTSLENWCERKPVMKIETVEVDDAVQHRVFEVNNTSSRWIVIEGHNLGTKPPSGAVGKVEVKNDNGDWVNAPVWNEQTKNEVNGWSDDGKVLYARIPLSKDLITSNATPGMNPADLYAAKTKAYEIRLTRPLDAQADPLVLTDGAQTVGVYHLNVKPIVLEVQFNAASANTTELRGEFCHPKWLLSELTELATGFYRKTPGAGEDAATYSAPFLVANATWFEDINWLPDPNVACDETKSGIKIESPDPQVFDGNVVYILSYH